MASGYGKKGGTGATAGEKSECDNPVGAATPLHILKRLRQREGLEESDASRDAELNAQSPMEKLRNVIGWELGDPRWADQFLTWAKDCGVQIVDPRD